MSEQQTDTAKSGAVRTLRRELKARHLAMIAIGGSIGTGLFVAFWTDVLLKSASTRPLTLPRAESRWSVLSQTVK